MTVTNIQEDFLLICLLCNKSCRENIMWGSFRMAKDKKQSRPKAETPKGFRDYFDQEVSERNEMLQKVASVYHHHGFDALETSAVENVDVRRIMAMRIEHLFNSLIWYMCQFGLNR